MSTTIKDIQQWIDWILEYGDHKDNCTYIVMTSPSRDDCDCGWYQVRGEVWAKEHILRQIPTP